MRISDWSSDVCSSDLRPPKGARGALFLWPRTDYGIRARSGSSESRIPNPQSPIPNPRLPMINITLPDGSRREFDKPVSVMDVPQSIGPGLANATVAGQVEGHLVDALDILDIAAAHQILHPMLAEGVASTTQPHTSLVGHRVTHNDP